MTPLIGRAEALAQTLAALERGGCVTLKGPPGAGKSTLAREVLRQVKWPKVELSCQRPLSRLEVLSALAAAAGAPVSSPEARVAFEHLAATLDARACVLVLDGPFASEPGTVEVLLDLLLATEHVRALVCAGRPLDLTLEQVVPVTPLDAEDSVTLLKTRLRALAAPPVSSEEGVALAATAEGLPLALELVAARVAALGPRVVLEQRGLKSEVLDRSIAAAVATLREADARALGCLSVFRGAFDAARAAQVTGEAEALERLCAASLVHAGDGAFRLLDSIRDFAARVADPAVLDAARLRHCDALAALAAAPATLRDELLDAWEWAITRAPVRALQLACLLDPVLVAQGPGSLHRRVLETSLAAAAEPSSAALRGQLLLALGRFDALRSQHRAALRSFEAALLLGEQTKDLALQGWACARSCYSLRALGEHAAAHERGQRALRLARETRDLGLTGMTEQVLGTLARARGNDAEAEQLYRRAAGTARVAHAPRLLGIALANLASLQLWRGELDAATGLFAEARACFEAAQDLFHLSRLSVDEAALAVRRRAADAEAQVNAALDSATASGSLEGQLQARELLVELAELRGDSRLAEQRRDALAALARVSDDVAWPAPRAPSVPGSRPLLRLSRDGRRVEWAGGTLDFSRRGPLRRVLLALVEARLKGDDTVLVGGLREAGWPGEKMFADSASARVYMAIRRLRELGLEAVLLTRDDGYRLSPELDVAWLDG